MSHPYSALIFDCKSLSQLFEEAHIYHTYCKGNQGTDVLAKEGFSPSNSFAQYSHHNFCILHQLLIDTWGVSYLILSIMFNLCSLSKKKKKTHKISRELDISIVSKIRYVFDTVNIRTSIIRHLFKKYVSKIRHKKIWKC